MEFLFNALVYAVVFVISIAIHEAGHYVAGVLIGIPRQAMKIVLFPRGASGPGELPPAGHVSLRDGDDWVSPWQRQRFVAIYQRLTGFPDGSARGRRWTLLWITGGYLAQTLVAVAAFIIARVLEPETVARTVATVFAGVSAIFLLIGIGSEIVGLRVRSMGGTDLRGVLWMSRPLGIGFAAAVVLVGAGILVLL